MTQSLQARRLVPVCCRPLPVRPGAARHIPATRVLQSGDVSSRLYHTLGVEHARLVVEHEPIEFSSYPYEWPPETLLPAGYGLKDTTLHNGLFRAFFAKVAGTAVLRHRGRRLTQGTSRLPFAIW